ncbi:hypothetical protein HSHS1_13100 [Helicobacter suis HS1]|nr:hypothetical protein HSHS1_13100 [Helicobacter suis HS1]
MTLDKLKDYRALRNAILRLLPYLDSGITELIMIGVQFDNGFILGKFGFPKLRDVCYDKPLGAMIVAPRGAGKTACVALPNHP